MAGASDNGGGAAFARTLSALKERGSNLLVIGACKRQGHVDVCDRLLGEPAEQRRRLLVRVDGQCGAVPDDDGVRSRVVERRQHGFGGPDSPVDVDDVRRTGGDIDELERSAVEAFTGLEDDGAAPGELRLCVDSLRPLIIDHGDARVRRFVDQLASRISRADGMGHFHLPVDTSDKYVSMLTPVVDAVVEVRYRGGQPQQRWHVFDGAVDSGWLPL